MHRFPPPGTIPLPPELLPWDQLKYRIPILGCPECLWERVCPKIVLRDKRYCGARFPYRAESRSQLPLELGNNSIESFPVLGYHLVVLEKMRPLSVSVAVFLLYKRVSLRRPLQILTIRPRQALQVGSRSRKIKSSLGYFDRLKNVHQAFPFRPQKHLQFSRN
jgi:hypothetical protein